MVIKMKKTVKILAMLICSAVMSGCFGKTEVNDRAFVQLMGIEKHSGVYMVSLQIYESCGSDGVPDVSKANSSAVAGTGTDVNAALSECELKAGKKIFLGHIKTVIIGSGITELPEILSSLTDGGSPRGTVPLSCPIAYSTSPSSVTETFMEQGVFSADRFTDITEGYVRSGKCVYTDLISVTEKLSLPSGAAALPVIYSDGKEIYYSGIAAVNKNGGIYRISEPDVQGFVILSGSFDKKGSIAIPVPDDESSGYAEITCSKVKTCADISDGRLRINAEVRLKLKTNGSDENYNEKKAAEAVCENIRDSCISAYSETAWYGGCDVFGIYKLMRRDCPSLAEKDAETVIKESILSITVKAETE